MARSELNVRLGLVTRAFDQALGRTQRKLNRFAFQMQGIGRNLTQSVTLPLAGIGGVALKTAADFEQLRTSFGVLLGDVERGNKLFAELQEFAAGTPFQLQDIAGAAKQLLAFSFSAEETKNALQFLGDIAAGTGSNLSDLALIVGQARAIGAAYTQDLRQLANRGIPVFDLLKDKLNISGAELKKFISDGKVSFELLRDVLRESTEGTGKFAGGLAAQSKTLAGLFSTLKDNVSLALADLGETIKDAFELDTVFPEVVRRIQDAVKVFKALDSQTKKNIISNLAFAAAIGPVIFGIGKVVSLFGSTFALLRKVNSGLGALVAPLIGASTGFSGLRASISGAVTAFGKFNTAQKVFATTIVGAALAGLVFAISKFVEYRNSIRQAKAAVDELKTGQGALRDASREAIANINTEVAKLDALIAVVQDETKAEEDRLGALNKLKNDYPGYFEQVDLDNIKTGSLTIAKDELTKSIIRNARAQAAASRIQELANVQLDKEEELTQARIRQEEVVNQLQAKGFRNVIEARKEVQRFLGSIERTGEKQAQFRFDGVEELVNAYDSANDKVFELAGSLDELSSAQEKLAKIAATGVEIGVGGQVTGTENPAGTGKPIVDPDNVVIISNTEKALAAFDIALAKTNQTTATFQEKSQLALTPFQELSVALNTAAERGRIFGDTGAVIANQISLIENALSGSGFRDFTENQLTTLLEKLGVLKEQFAEIQEELEKTKEVQDAFSSAFAAGSDIITNAAAEEGSALKRLSNVVLTEVAKQLRARLQAAVGAQIEKIIAAVPFPFNIALAAGAGAIISALFSAAVSKVGVKLAEGGIIPPGFPNDTFPALLSSGEAVIPLDKLGNLGGPVEVVGIIRGEDIFLSNKRASARLNRLR